MGYSVCVFLDPKRYQAIVSALSQDGDVIDGEGDVYSGCRECSECLNRVENRGEPFGSPTIILTSDYSFPS